MAIALQDRKRATSELKSWLDDVAAYEREFRKWESRTEKIIRRYRDEQRDHRDVAQSKFNILWSNVQTLMAATYSRVPKPDVARRFRDNDPVGRVASLILERDLDFHVQHYSDFRQSLKQAVLDRFLGGRGVVWIRYEPHFKDAELPDGVEITEDVESESDEELDYECTAVDYVHWKDFGHNVARTWEEVNRVWRCVYMTREACTARFGEKIGKLIPMDASPKEVMNSSDYKPGDAIQRAKIYEGWDKESRCAVWFSKSLKDCLDERDDPLSLEDFFPCPRPLYATMTNESLVPLPDFTLYQDQANELDTLADRIDGLVKALQVKGVYDASQGSVLSRIFTEGSNGQMFPVKNWAAFAEKNGLRGAIDLIDLKPIAEALEAAYGAMEQIKNQIYEITGISDIVRGQTAASETATAQQLKGQYASLRLKTYQDDVARFATEILQIMAQIMCRKFQGRTIVSFSAADQLSANDQPFIGPALELLLGPRAMRPEAAEGPNPLRSFRIEIASDTMVQMDEQAEKESRVEFLTATGTFLEKAATVVGQAPPESKAPLIGLLMEMLKFGVTAFKVGKTIEGTFDETAEQLKKTAALPPPPSAPDPRVQAETIKANTELQVAPVKAQAEMARANADVAQSQASMVVASHKVRQATMNAMRPQQPMPMPERPQ